MEKIICISHNCDLDGHTSAAIIKKKYPDAMLIGWNYGEEIPDIPSGHNVIMADISFPMDKMVEIAGKSESFTWIDHHISAIKEYEKYPHLTEPLFKAVLPKKDEQIAACELTWRYIHPNDRLPEVIRLLGAYDVFRHKGTHEEQNVLQFQFAMRSHFANPEQCARIFEMVHEDVEQYMFVEGKAIYNYLKTEARDTFKKGFPVEVDGYKFICLDGDRVNPINFGISYHDLGYDGSACFWYEGDKWHFSLYNDNGKVDCSVLAKKRGGGGHFSASGFNMNNKEFYDFISTKII